MHYYQFHIGDYISHTIHLSLEEDLAYRRLLDMYYDTEKPIPNNIPLVSRRLRMGSDVVESVLNEFFELSEDGFRNLRADLEIREYHAFIDKQRNNGKLGGRPKKTQRKPTANPSKSQKKPNQEPTTINHKPINKATDVATPIGVSLDVWLEFVAHRKAKKAKVTELVLQGLINEAEKAGWTLEDVLKEIVVRNWQSFKADWVQPRTLVNNTQTLSRTLSNKFDIAHITTPTPANHDAELKRIIADDKKAAPVPDSVRDYLKKVKA